MKTAIVKFSQLDIKCMSALRYTHSCECCDRVERCKLPEAREGRIKILDLRIAKAKKNLHKLKEQRTKKVLEGLKEDTKR